MVCTIETHVESQLPEQHWLRAEQMLATQLSMLLSRGPPGLHMPWLPGIFRTCVRYGTVVPALLPVASPVLTVTLRPLGSGKIPVIRRVLPELVFAMAPSPISAQPAPTDSDVVCEPPLVLRAEPDTF